MYVGAYLVSGELLPDHLGGGVEGEVDLEGGQVHLLQGIRLKEGFLITIMFGKAGLMAN